MWNSWHEIRLKEHQCAHSCLCIWVWKIKGCTCLQLPSTGLASTHHLTQHVHVGSGDQRRSTSIRILSVELSSRPLLGTFLVTHSLYPYNEKGGASPMVIQTARDSLEFWPQFIWLQSCFTSLRDTLILLKFLLFKENKSLVRIYKEIMFSFHGIIEESLAPLGNLKEKSFW